MAEAFFDGGSIIIEFEDLDGAPWQLYMNQRIDETDQKEKGSIRVTRLSDGFQKPVYDRG